MDKAFDPVKGLGLNIVRYNIGGGENPEHSSFMAFRAAVPGYEPTPGVWDWTADANQRWVLKEAIKRGANQLEAFSNSPPWWMTRSGSVTGNHGGTDNLKPEDDAAFGDYLATVVKHFHDDWGITFRDVEPLNEPIAMWWTYGGASHGQEGCHVDRPHQNDVVKATEAALARQNIGYTTTTASDESFVSDAILTFGAYDATALKGLTKINTHSYSGGNRAQLSQSASSHGKDLWLSEYGEGDASGMQLSRQILTDVNGLHPSAWVYWQVVDGGGWGLLTNPLDSEAHTDYGINKKYYVFGQYSKFIRPGCKLIGMTDGNSLAALDARTNTLTFVTTNSGDTASQVVYDLSAFTRLGASATATRTSATEAWAKLPAQAITGKHLTVTLPAKSVTTFVIAGAAYTGPMAADYSGKFTLASNNNPGQALSWGLQTVGGGFYKLVNPTTGLVLDVSQSSTQPGAEVLQYADNGGDNQQWRLAPVTFPVKAINRHSGVFKVINRHSGLLLSIDPSGKMTQETDNGSAGQLWRLQPKITP